MPEGPSLVIAVEATAGLVGQTVLHAEGTTPLPLQRVVGERVQAIRSWGKHLLIEFDGFTLRIHFLLFGSYLVNARKPGPPRLRLGFADGEFNAYACALQYIEGPLAHTYDWRADVMAPQWDARLALRKLRAMPQALVCDALLDQNVFAGVGNIIKNEVLFRIRVDPRSQVGALPVAKLRELVREARRYSFEFLAWKQAGVLKQHWLAHTRHDCARCGQPLICAELGQTRRRSFYCPHCQRRHLLPVLL
ncbi:endonuclease [Chitiniphilus purpureus]|uniref:Endonuclease n=1 Tax=Chitiniphilus purpureus TaxID=2981137 RepID=A0ABY6DMN3_9NEIS|nr:DNA-formamidopyrimidine glycosylase family protein [Chitiniphilus sp. CD1]UXY15468.1 endonuclease [Chitiniphilus sp. CD1]